MAHETAGDPISGLKWTRRTTERIATELRSLDSHIREVYDEHKQRYGVPRITDGLRDRGLQCSENRVARRMKSLGLKGIQAASIAQNYTKG